jgi:purine-binding chemotaxis protein CheW
MGADISSGLCGRYLIFHLAEQTYAVPIAAVEEIVPMAELAQVAGAPPFLAGFLDVAGHLVAVVSLRRLFALSDKPRELYTPIIILKAAARRIALEVDEVREIAAIADEDAIVLEGGCMFNDVASAAARLQGVTVLLLAPERLLLEEEHRRLQALSEMAGDRLAAVEAASA